MTIYQPFSETYLIQAAMLLAQRHRHDVTQQSALPTHFNTVDIAQQAIQAILEKDHTTGVAALADDTIVAYMLGTLIEQDYLGDYPQGWVYLPSYAISDTRYVPDLYARIADTWVKQGCYQHYTLVAASDTTLQDAWFSLSFGREQAHGVLDLSAFEHQPSVGDLSIRLATADDEQHFRGMSQWISRYQLWTPTFAPVTQDYLSNQSDAFATLKDDTDATTFLAFKDNMLVGYNIYYDVDDNITDMMHDSDAIELVVAATHPDYRGQGIGQTLANFAFSQMAQRGYQRCVTDWRTANRASSNFWRAMGFIPTHYRLVRRLDHRISTIYKELHP